MKPSGGMTGTPEISSPARATRWDRRACRTSAARRPFSPLMDTNAPRPRSADVNCERHRIVDKAAAVLHGQGRHALRRWRRLRRREHGGFRRLPGGRKRSGSWPAGRCVAGIAMTRSVAMLAAIATAIERRMNCWSTARRPDSSRARRALRSARFPSPPAWPGRRPWRTFRSWRRGGLPMVARAVLPSSFADATLGLDGVGPGCSLSPAPFARRIIRRIVRTEISFVL